MNNYVWEFTNQRKLTKSEFINYFERKIFRTIRKFEMLPKDKIITLKKANDLNTNVLKTVLEKKFQVKYSSKPNFSSQNLSKAAEDTFKNVLNGKFTGPKPNNSPLYYLSDEEVELYASLTGIKGDKRPRNEKVQDLFKKFKKKNQDLEVNVVKALSQIQK